jgi:hypothetical protein
MPPKVPQYKSPLQAILQGGKQAVSSQPTFGIPTQPTQFPSALPQTAQTTRQTVTSAPIQVPNQTPLPAVQPPPVNPLDIIRRGKEQSITQGTPSTLIPDRTGLFAGTGRAEMPAVNERIFSTISRAVREKGLLPAAGELLFGEFNKLVAPNPEQYTQMWVEDRDSLVKSGIALDRAEQVATQNIFNQTRITEGATMSGQTKVPQSDLGIELTPEEKGILRGSNIMREAFAVLDTPIFFGTTKPISMGAKFLLKPAKYTDEMTKAVNDFADVTNGVKKVTPDEKIEIKATAQRLADEMVARGYLDPEGAVGTDKALANLLMRHRDKSNELIGGTKAVDEAPKKSIIETAKDNLRNPAMRQGGYAGRVPEEIKRISQVDSQPVSLPKTVAQKTPTRIKLDAELGDIRKSLQNKELNVQKIGELETRLSILEESAPDVKLLRQIGRKQLSNGDTLSQVQASAQKLRNESDFIKSISRTEANAILANPKNYTTRQVEAARVTRRAGLDDIITEYGYRNLDEADEAINQFNRIRDEIAEARTQMREVKGDRALSNKVAKVVSASTTERRSYVNFLRDNFNLVDSDVRKAARGRDFRMMGERDFDSFVRNLEQIAVERADTTQAKIELMDLIERRNFQREQAYRKVAGFPSLSEMNAKQMREYADTLEKYQEGDIFLTERQLEVVDRSDLAGIRTMREAKEKLLEKIRQKSGFENTTLADLQVTPKAIDNLAYDTALADKNPFYNHLVTRTQEHMVAGEAHFLDVQSKVLDLAGKANASRNRGALGGARQMFVPKHEEIIRYLEAPLDQKNTFAKALTKEELDYANFVQQYYSEAYEHLVKIKELYGSRYVDQYFTHIRRDFLEAWADDGFVKAMKEWWQSQKDNQVIANIIDQDTGQILSKSKFFQYTLQRTGEITPSKNLTRVFLQYAKTFERKKMFDSMIPELDIYTQSLSPTNLTPKGLEMDRRLKTFVNEYLNNKKGRRINYSGLIPQNGVADVTLRMGNTLVSVIDLGLSFIAQSAATVGELVATYQSLGKIGTARAIKRRVWDTGVKRMGDKNATAILKQAEPFIGRNIWTELSEVDTPIIDKGIKVVFGGFSQATVEANKLFLLGSISKAELASGTISPARMAELRLAAGRWRDMGRDVKSIVGATSLGGMLTKYKGWAIPIARTTVKNLDTIAKNLSQGKFRETATSKELAETFRMVELSTAVVMIGMYVNAQDKDDSFVGKLKARAYMEANTLLSGIDPLTFLSTPRLITFTQQLAKNLRSIALLETYETDSQWGEAGDLKGVKGLQRQLTPATIRQFQNTTPSTGDAELDDALKQQEQSKKEAEESFTLLMKELDTLPAEQRRDRLMREDEATINKVIAEIEKRDKPTVSKEQERQDKAIQRLGVTNGARAQYVYTKMNQMPAEERRQYILDLLERGIISDNVVNQVIKLIEQGDIIE